MTALTKEELVALDNVFFDREKIIAGALRRAMSSVIEAQAETVRLRIALDQVRQTNYPKHIKIANEALGFKP